jgi:hypothetical protein
VWALLGTLCGLFWGAPRRRIRGRGTHKSVTINGVKIIERRVKTAASGAPSRRTPKETTQRSKTERRERRERREHHKNVYL